jgi:hypothetical protein
VKAKVMKEMRWQYVGKADLAARRAYFFTYPTAEAPVASLVRAER